MAASTKPKGQAPEAPKQQPEAAAPVASEPAPADRVALVSYRADGTPDQVGDFEVIGGEQ